MCRDANVCLFSKSNSRGRPWRVVVVAVAGISRMVASLPGLPGLHTNVFDRIDCEFMHPPPGRICYGSSGTSRRFERRRCCHVAVAATLSLSLPFSPFPSLRRYAPYSMGCAASSFARTITNPPPRCGHVARTCSVQRAKRTRER